MTESPAKSDTASNSGAISDFGIDTTSQSSGEAIHDYEPSDEEVLGYLANLNVSTQIFRGLLENAASFYGSQMSAMDSATRNAGEMIEGLTLYMNKVRQAAITREIIEVVSGAQAQ